MSENIENIAEALGKLTNLQDRIEWAMTNDRQIRSSEITPTPELLEQWEAETAHTTKDESWHVAVQAARWGADQELKACCVLMDKWGLDGEDLVECRRPKPPSLKEQALETLQRLSKDGYPCNYQEDADWDTIRRALEQLND